MIHRYLLKIAPKTYSPSHLNDGKFYSKHTDEKGDQILVNNEFNIAEIIDWEWAHTDSKSSVFNSPIVPLPFTDFYTGKNYIGEDEELFAQYSKDNGHPDLAIMLGMVGLFKGSDFFVAMTLWIGRDFWVFWRTSSCYRVH